MVAATAYFMRLGDQSFPFIITFNIDMVEY
jgi:hypothetical protein